MRIHNLRYYISKININQSFKAHLNNSTDKLQQYKPKSNNFVIPYLIPSQQSIKQIFNNHKLQQKQIILHIDPSGLLGMKRQFFRSLLVNNIYKNIEQPNQKLVNQNPSEQIKIEQLNFVLEIYNLMDSMVDSTKIKIQQSMQIIGLDQQISQIQKLHPQRNRQRLISELKVPQQYIFILQKSVYQNNQIYFSGLNQYTLRKILSSYYNLSSLKGLMRQCLDYTYSKTRKIQDFVKYSREFIYLSNYTLLESFEIKKVKALRQKFPKSIFFGQKYIIESMETESNQNVALPIQEDEDIIRIQKNAILEILLGRLWDQPYTKNKFPYLTQDFISLPKEDQKQVKQIYTKNIAKYMLVKKNYHQYRVKQSI